MDAYETLDSLAPWEIVTEDMFNLLRKNFLKQFLLENNYEGSLRLHRRQIEVKNEILKKVYDCLSKIQQREEMRHLDPKQNIYGYVPTEVSEIWKSDKTLKSLYNTIKAYCIQYEKDFKIISIHIAEYRAMIKLSSNILRSLRKNNKYSMSTKDNSTEVSYLYDVALSFAGEDRTYVEEVAVLLQKFGVKVFYDRFEETNLWGKNLYEHLSEIYKNKARYTVMFISKYYKEKLWAKHERKSMQDRDFSESQEYILPARFDETEIPGLHSTIGYIDLRSRSPYQLASLILAKIGVNTKNRWWGDWRVEAFSSSFLRCLEIKNVKSDNFDFQLASIHGAHSGEISGMAKLESKGEAKASISTSEDSKECILKFHRVDDSIHIEENQECFFFHGMRAHFEGNYKLKKDIFYEFDFMNDLVLSNIYQILGKDLWKIFIDSFGDVRYTASSGKAPNLITGGIAGLYTIMEAIIMVDDDNRFWGAFIDDESVRYFSSENDWKNRLPEQIEEWRTNFKEKVIVCLK